MRSITGIDIFFFFFSFTSQVHSLYCTQFLWKCTVHPNTQVLFWYFCPFFFPKLILANWKAVTVKSREFYKLFSIIDLFGGTKGEFHELPCQDLDLTMLQWGVRSNKFGFTGFIYSSTCCWFLVLQPIGSQQFTLNAIFPGQMTLIQRSKLVVPWKSPWNSYFLIKYNAKF